MRTRRPRPRSSPAWNIIEMGKSKRGESSSDAYKKAKTAVLDAFKAATSDASTKTAQLIKDGDDSLVKHTERFTGLEAEATRGEAKAYASRKRERDSLRTICDQLTALEDRIKADSRKRGDARARILKEQKHQLEKALSAAA